MKIGFLGPKGTFSHEAVSNIYGHNEEIIECRTIKECIVNLEKKKIDRAVVPIENSLQGGVTETIDSLVESHGIFIEKEYTLKINQNLIANSKIDLDEIQKLYSHPQAISQCRDYIEKNLKNAEIIQVSSTALAAKEIKEKDMCACIANTSCIHEYGLTILAANIQDIDTNQTKFLVLSNQPNEDGKKMTIIFSTQNKPGALYEVLGIFNRKNINMTKIESRPAKTILGEYIFIVDIEVNDEIDETINELTQICKFIKVLGKY